MEREHRINMNELSESSNSSAGLSCSPAFTLNNNAVSFKVKNQQSAKTLINQQKQKHDVESVIDKNHQPAMTVMYQQEKKQEKAIKTHFYWSLFNTLFCCFFCACLFLCCCRLFFFFFFDYLCFCFFRIFVLFVFG